jgi:hypothetical protein
LIGNHVANNVWDESVRGIGMKGLVRFDLVQFKLCPGIIVGEHKGPEAVPFATPSYRLIREQPVYACAGSHVVAVNGRRQKAVKPNNQSHEPHSRAESKLGMW